MRGRYHHKVAGLNSSRNHTKRALTATTHTPTQHAMSARYVKLEVSGTPGSNGVHGRNGSSPGADGTNAGPATRGGHAGNIDCILASNGDNVQTSWTLSNTGQSRSSMPNSGSTAIHAAEFSSLFVKAVGGKGGRGGDGGHGKKGHTGSKGRDATRHSAGGDGGPGGRGGDGGAGTNGEDAGNGGQIMLRVGESDEYLLSAVNNLLHPNGLTSGAPGGAAGKHGRAGAGGQGGPGGNACSWTTQEGDEEHRRTVHHRNPGGRRGPSGPAGRAPHYPLHSGHDSTAGSLGIAVTGQGGLFPNGSVTQFSRRYNIDVASATIAEGSGPNVDGVLEFGELCHVTKVQLHNDGGMPTPSLTRVRVHTKPTRWTAPTGQEVYHNIAIPVNSTVEAQGAIGFKIGFPPEATLLSDPSSETADNKPNDHDYDPLVHRDVIEPIAVVLGHEDGSRGYYGPSTLFQRTLSTGACTNPITVRFPVEQQSGIEAISTLAIDETTLVHFAITNISHTPLGGPDDRRKLQVRLWVHDEELKASDFFFRTTDMIDNEGVADETPLAYPGRLWPCENWHLEAGETKRLEGRLKLVSGQSYQGAELRAVVYMSDIDNPDEWRVIHDGTHWVKVNHRVRPRD